MKIRLVMIFALNSIYSADIKLSANRSDLAKIISYNYIAGGVVGYNMGYLYQVKAEHEATLQANIESSMEEYYNATTQEEKVKTNRVELPVMETPTFSCLIIATPSGTLSEP